MTYDSEYPHNCKTDDRALPIDRPCSACSAGDSQMKFHLHCPPFSSKTPANRPTPSHYHKHPDDSYSACDCDPNATPDLLSIARQLAEAARGWHRAIKEAGENLNDATLALARVAEQDLTEALSAWHAAMKGRK